MSNTESGPVVRGLTGICIVRNQYPTIALAIRSLSNICEDFVLIDNDSSDGTLQEIESAVDSFGLDAEVISRGGNAAEILYEELRKLDGFVFRFEGDQIFFPDRTLDVIDERDERKTVNTKCLMVRNRYDLRNSNYDTNAPHPTVMDASGGFVMQEGIQWPRGDYSESRSIHHPISVNCRVNSPEERIKRWHWDCWRWKDKIPPYNFHLDEYSQPYQDYMTLEEYVWKLRERGKGSSDWEGDTLQEVGLNYLKWDVENNCREFDGPYPPVLQSHIEEFGYSGVLDILDEI